LLDSASYWDSLVIIEQLASCVQHFHSLYAAFAALRHKITVVTWAGAHNGRKPVGGERVGLQCSIDHSCCSAKQWCSNHVGTSDLLDRLASACDLQRYCILIMCGVWSCHILGTCQLGGSSSKVEACLVLACFSVYSKTSSLAKVKMTGAVIYVGKPACQQDRQRPAMIKESKESGQIRETLSSTC